MTKIIIIIILSRGGKCIICDFKYRRLSFFNEGSVLEESKLFYVNECRSYRMASISTEN
jgi:hypothetical protein